MGESVRADSWSRLIAAIGASVSEVPVFADHRVRIRRRSLPDIGSVLRGAAVPESLLWSARQLASRLEEHAPDRVIFMTSRAFTPLAVDTPHVLDHVDHLGANYRQRAEITPWTSPRGCVLRTLGPLHDRFDTWARDNVDRRVAAGFGDAQVLGAQWMPILAPEPRTGDRAPEVDLVFFGNLTYEPNVAAVERMARLWPAIQRRRAGTTMLVAGRYVSARVRAAREAHGWALEEDFADIADLCSSARVGVAPLPIATGIQTKVLDAAAFGLAQVISTEAARGFGPHVPARVASDDAQFVDEIVQLLEDDTARRQASEEALDIVNTHYSVAAWADATRTLLGLV